MDDITKTAASTEVDLAQRLANVEELLNQQLEVSKKIAKHRGTLSFLMLCLVLVFAAGLFALNFTAATVTRDLPQLIETTNESAQQLDETLKDISGLDFESMNSAIADLDKGISAIDFEALNSAIVELKKATEGLARLTSIF